MAKVIKKAVIMDKLLGWTKSTRSIAVVILCVGATAGMFMRIISAEMYANAVMLVLGAYFGKRDTPEDRK